MNPLVSVLIPIYNVERYLPECLRSLEAQDFKQAEFICINDGSTDGSRAIIEEFLNKDSRFRVIDKENSGYGASMNRGLEAAQGDYIAILESDDFMEADTLSKLHHAISSTGADVIKANFWMYWSIPTKRNDFFEAIPGGKSERMADPARDPFIFYTKPSIWSAIYRKSFLDKEKISFLETPGASFQDTSFTFKVWASTHKVYYLHDAFVHYRQDNENSSVNSPGKVDALFNEYREISRWLEMDPAKQKTFSPIKVKMLYDALIWNYERVAEEHKVEVLRKGRAMFLDDFARGNVDIRLFEPWKLLDMQKIMILPEKYHRDRSRGEAISQRVGRVIQERGFNGFVRAGAAKVVNKGKGLVKSCQRYL